MRTIIKPSRFKGELNANPSKSVMQRVIAIAALSSDETLISNIDRSKDSMAALDVVKAMGVGVEIEEDNVRIMPSKSLKNGIWNVNESGLSARMFAPIAGLFKEDVTITGKGSLMKRPMHAVIESLEQLGLEVEHNNSFLPIVVKGQISNYNLNLDLSSGSQILTGLMIALSKAKKDSVILVKNLKSKPYIDLTSCVLTSFGNRINIENYKKFEIPGNAKLGRKEFEVEGDWSGVAFHLVGAAINGSVKIQAINPKSKQSDKAILEVLKSVGAKIEVNKRSVYVEKGKLNSFEFDATDAPDLFPPLAVLAAYCNGVSRIKGVSRLQHKESDRYTTIKVEFEKVGIKVEKEGDFMLIHGGQPKGALVDSHNDHRIAMAMATLGLKSSGSIEIENSECISKSYPHYFEDFKRLGGDVI